MNKSELVQARLNWTRETMDDWGLQEVRIDFIKAATILGMASTNGLLSINLYLLRDAPDYFYYDTILHEIAHFKAGIHNGHNHIWKQWCIEVGADPTRTTPWQPVKEKWEYYCPECGGITKRTFRRRPKKSLLRVCSKCKVQIKERRIQDASALQGN